MAIVKAPALSLDASGNLGGICYSKWRGMHVARDTWTGTVPNTPKQQTIQGYMTTVSQAWSGTLSEGKRRQWCEVAKNLVRVSRGMVKYVPSGYQYFMEVNMVRKRIGLAILQTPPSGIPEGGIGEVELVFDGIMSEVDIELTEVFNQPAPDMRVDVWKAGPYTNGGRHAIAGEYRFLKMWQGLIDGSDAAIVLGKYYWYKTRWLWDYGAAGNWFERQVLTA